MTLSADQWAIGYGKTAYEAYGRDADWKTYDGRPMPTWDDLTEAVRGHWIAAALAVESEAHERNRP